MSETVGFTGTRAFGPAALAIVRWLLGALPAGTRVVVGGCIGVDAAVARVARARGLWVHAVIPADRSRVDPGWRSCCDSFEELAPATTYRDRNVRIVAQVSRLYGIPAYPEHDPRSRRSGSWQTIRLGRAARIPVVVTVVATWREAPDPTARSDHGAR